LEPILVAIVVILLIALFLPEVESGENYRLKELHIQDVASIIQKTGVIHEDCDVIGKEVERLVSELNPRYGSCFRVYGRGCSRECPEEKDLFCTRRSYADPEKSIKIEVCLF